MADYVNDRGNRVVSSGKPSSTRPSSSKGQRPGARPAAGQHSVIRHRRTVETRRGLFGPKKRKVPVKRHTRSSTGSSRKTAGGQRKTSTKKRYQRRAQAVIGPKAAKKNLKQAWRKNRKGRNGQAVALAAFGAVQLLAWLAIQGTFLLIAACAVIFAAVALVIDEVTSD